jgi:glutamyl-tRNA reductase
MRRRGNRPVFIIDLAVPRDVDPAVNDLDGVYLYDIDALQDIAAQSMAIRRHELAECERLIERHVGEFAAWLANGGGRTSAAMRAQNPAGAALRTQATEAS